MLNLKRVYLCLGTLKGKPVKPNVSITFIAVDILSDTLNT